MKLNIKATDLELNDAMRTYIDDKIASISKWVKRYDKGDDLLLNLEIARTTKHHHKGDVFYAEITLQLPDRVIRAEVHDSDVKKALLKVRNLVKRDLRKYKTARIFKIRRKGR